jgi:hypothetical protein
MMHPDLLYQAAKARERELIQAAERERLRLDSAPQTPGLSDRVLLAVSDLLIAGGRRLRPTQEPTVSPRALATPAGYLPLLPSAGRPTITMQLAWRDSEAFCLTYCRLDAPRPATAPGVTYLALLWQPDRLPPRSEGKR